MFMVEACLSWLSARKDIPVCTTTSHAAETQLDVAWCLVPCLSQSDCLSLIVCSCAYKKVKQLLVILLELCDILLRTAADNEARAITLAQTWHQVWMAT